MSREKHTTPAWVAQLNEDTIVKDAEDTSWFSGGYFGMPTRFHSEGGYINAYDSGYHKGFHDETSLRTGSSVSSRRRRNSCCLALFLILAALLVAVGIGLMVYYLMKPDPTKYQAKLANGSLPLMNVPYHQEMKDSESQSFKNIEDSLCQKLDMIFKDSVYKDQYEYCKIQYLRLDDSPLPCACSNITDPAAPDNAKAYINLVFRGDVHRQIIHTIIEKHTRRVVGLDYDVLMIDDFIVDIESHLAVSTSTAKPLPDVGVRANLTIWVYNLTYTADLENRDSISFRELAGPFCNDLRRIFLTSELKSRFHSCKVQKFSPKPDIVITDVWFTGDDISDIETSVRHIILDSARKVNVSGQVRQMIGTLLITPKTGNDSNMGVVVIPLNPETTIAPTPSTRPPNWKDGMPYVELLLNFTGVDYNASLWDTSSDFFKYHAEKFCKEFERMILLSTWKQNYYECNMLNIYPPPSHQLYPYLRTVLHVTSNTRSPSELTDIIKEKADKYIFPGNLETYRIGDLYIILTDGQFSIYTTIYDIDTTFVMPTTTKVFPSIFTSYSFSTPTRSAGDTDVPPVSTIIIVYNATAAFIESHLIDFDYTPDLKDSSSMRFMLLEEKFCKDIDGYFSTSSLQRYYENCRILSFSPDPKFTFVLHFTAPRGEYLQTAVPSVIIQNAPKVQIGEYSALSIGGLNLLYDVFKFTVSATNHTFDKTPSILPTETMTMTTTMIPPVYSATLVNIFCDVASDISPEFGNRDTEKFRAQEKSFCKAISDIFNKDINTEFLDCYILQFSEDTSTVQFHAIFAEDATQKFGDLVVDMVHVLAKSVLFEQRYRLDIGGVMVEPYSCRMNVYPVNYTDPQTTLFTTLTPTTQVVLPTAGVQHCLRNPCKNGGTCVETMESYRCTCKSGFEGHDCETDVDECLTWAVACENGGTCKNKWGGHICECYPGYSGERCEIVQDRCASNPCKNGASCTGSLMQPCICASGWQGVTCEEDVDECKFVPSICKFNGICKNEIGSFTCECVNGRTGPTCNIGIDECTTIQPCRHGATCLDTDYSYKCVCKTGWTGENCTDDDDECSRDICENGGTCENTVGGFICNCTSGWTGPTCNSRYDECKGQNPCLHDGICVDTSSDFKCLCKEGWEGDICERDINECLDTSICNGHGTCENTDGGFRCECFLQWTGKLCDDDHDECTDTSLGQLCYNGGQCINQWGSYQCDCPDNWTGLDCRTDVNECGQDPPVCLHGGTCSNQDGGFICTCTSGWTGNRCQQDIDECLPPSPCQNNATCTNKVGSFICDCRPGWRGTLCDQDIDECKETPGVCRNGGLCYNEEGDYRCKCPDGIGGKNCDYSTDPCNDMLCAYGGTCYIDTNGDPKCNCTEQYQGENCMEDFDECTLYPCVYGTCLNVIGSFYCDCNDGFTGKLCDEDENECLFYQCVNGYCNNTVGSFRCECNDGWTGQFCNIDVSECSLLENPCNGNGRCQETPGSYKCDCYLGYSGQFCQDDFDECSQIQCLNDGVCHNFLGGYQCNCTQFWTGPFCGIDLNECTTLEKPCLNGGTCKNRNMGYDCLCAKQWKGDVCDEDVDECSETMGLCMNNGTCMNEEGGFKCNCTKGYTGELCQTEQDECLLFQPCENGGTCKNMPGSYECMCAEGFSGRNCEIDINECLENRCKNNAECKNEPPGDYTCVCVDGWTGKDCDIEVARCPDCQNGGICENKDNKFRCICSTGWEGNTCETDVDECAEVPSRCQNGGTCKNEQGDYSCICLPGYEGKNCETNIDECSSGPCLFGGTCNDGIDSYTCDCPGGRRGTNCEIDIDECVMMPCQHEGKCENTDGSFLCNCTVGWEGPLCETDKDECLMMRCLHGGTCKNTMGSFECENCDRGWEGQLCDIDVDECTVSSSSPCENGATCRNIDGWFECDCAKGWRGLNCSTDINECVELGASACFGNGNCTNVDGDYLCNCSLGYTGEKCGEDIDECKTGDICKNGAECLNNNGSFTCICIAPWEGPECDRVGPNTFDLSFETVGLTITQDLLDTQSEMFQRKQDILCQDISTFVTDYLIPYESCSIVNFQENPAGLTLRLSFDDNFPAGVGATQIKDLLFEFRDRLRFDDVYGIRVGDMVFKHSDFISTDVTMSKRLLNFTYTNDLENENSFAFQQYEGAFCTNVREIMMTNAVMFPNFTSCDVTDFTFDSGMDETSVTYTFEFEWTQNADEIAATFDDYIDKNLPKVYFDLYETAKVGDFYMYIRDMPSYTSVPMSFALLDVSWDPALGNNQSSLFSTYSVPFCKELSNLIQQHSSFVDNYGGCNVMSYRDQTTDQQLVSVDINLDLYEKLDPYSVKREVANIIYNNAPEERYNDNIGYRVSDLILYESLRTYFDIPYDGWVANFTFSLFDYSSYKPSLLNSSSAEFKAKQSMFCNGSPDGNQFIGLTPLPEGPYEQRFYTCFVHSYKFDELSLSDSLTSTVSLVFFGTDPILGDELWDMIKAPLTVFPVGGDDDYYLIGYDLVKLKSVDEIKVNVSDYFLDETTTTPLPDIAYVLRMRFPLLNFTSLEDYQNTSSFLYQNSSEWFCSDMSKMFDTTVTWLPKYAGCGNISFSEEGAETYINFELAFHETITNETEAVARLLSVITEKAKRATLPDLTVAIVLGPFMVFQDSLQPSITNPEIFRTPSPTTGRK